MNIRWLHAQFSKCSIGVMSSYGTESFHHLYETCPRLVRVIIITIFDYAMQRFCFIRLRHNSINCTNIGVFTWPKSFIWPICSCFSLLFHNPSTGMCCHECQQVCDFNCPSQNEIKLCFHSFRSEKG